MKQFTYEDRAGLRETLKKGYTLEYIANNIEPTSYALRKEVKAGLDEDEWKLKLYGLYSPERAILTHIKQILDEKSIEMFARWFVKELDKKEKTRNGK